MIYQYCSQAFFWLPLLVVMLVAVTMISCSDDEPVFLQDQAGMLSAQQKEQITDYHQRLLAELGIHFKLIITAVSPHDINRTAAELFEDLGVQTGSARGLLYLVDPNGEKVRIEVGYDLESLFTDAFTGYIEEKQMVPFFETGRVATGVLAATELFVSRLLGTDESVPVLEVSGRQNYYSGGGGAVTAVEIGIKRASDKKDTDVDVRAQASPEEALAAYVSVLKAHIKNPQLGLYTPETRIFLADWVVTDAQQDNELRDIEKGVPEKIIIEGERAVIRYSVKERTRAPFFLQKGAAGWMFDFKTMAEVIRMNHKNKWHFCQRDHHYMFGFNDWYFDKNGFPHSRVNR